MPNSKTSGSRTSGGLAPEAHQFRRAVADDMRDDHAVDAAGRRGRRRIQVGIAIEPDQIEMFVVAPSAGKQTDGLRAVASENQHKRAAFHGDFGVRFSDR